MKRGYSLIALICIAISCSYSADERPVSSPVVGTGATARTLLAGKGFDWRVLETPHARLHAARRSRVFDRAPSLADSVEQARKAALSTLEENDLPGEPKIEVFLLDTREDMKQITGRTISGRWISRKRKASVSCIDASRLPKHRRASGLHRRGKFR